MSEIWNKIIGSYTDEKREWDKNYPWLYYVLRPVSFAVTAMISPLKVSANQITIVDLLCGLAACLFFLRGYPDGFFIGAVMFTCYNLLDNVDGNIARCFKTASASGKFFDAIASYPFLLVYFFIGIGVCNSIDFIHYRYGFLNISPETIGIVFLIIGSITTIAKFLSMDIKKTFFSILGQEWEGEKYRASTRGMLLKKDTPKWLRKLYVNMTDIQGHDFLLLIAAVTRTMDIFLVASALIAWMDTILMTYIYVSRALNLQGGKREN